MVGKNVSLEPSFDEYIAAVKEAFHDEPDEFKRLLDDYKDDDRACLIARIEQLMGNHGKLLPCFGVFHPNAYTTIPQDPEKPTATTIPHEPEKPTPSDATDHFNKTNRTEAETSIPPVVNRAIPSEPKRTILNDDANKGLGQLLARVSSELTVDDSKVAIPLVAKATTTPQAKITIKFLGKRTTYPIAKTTIPPEANRTIPLEAERTTTPQAKLTIKFLGKRTTYPIANTTIPPEASRTIPPEAKATIPSEPNAITLPEDRITTIPKAKTTIPTEAEHHGAESNCTDRKPVVLDDSLDFIKKLETRFRTIDTHVVGSYLKITTKYRKGKMSEKELHREVVDLLYYHEDLIEHFSSFLTQRYPIY